MSAEAYILLIGANIAKNRIGINISNLVKLASFFIVFPKVVTMKLYQFLSGYHFPIGQVACFSVTFTGIKQPHFWH
jgi:RNA-splicing ligase RtcB